ncbi:MAG: hypothetical protein BJ554DRAFT_3353 [Olpidium bornovanus]|uniref:Ribosomal RNA-processing protein 40 n=1 Tax=Olpidium bornovanus TaxID=278681 RepID=A0A8H7ZPK4_9FUNG|nr:MAG: hypothetical protein BJ554DRAFT_3353 [Olpidium bornovanus]
MVCPRKGLTGPGASASVSDVLPAGDQYVPALGDNVIGQITAKFADGYRVDVGGAHPALLDALAFEGANRRNKPQLAVGSLVYARVSLADKDVDPELECFNPATGKADGYGELNGGFVFQVTLGTCRRYFLCDAWPLLDPKTPVLEELGKQYAFEIAVGLNGRVWIDTASPHQTIRLSLAIKESDTA